MYSIYKGGKGSGVWPSMVTHTQNLCSAFNPSKCTYTVVNIHLEQWAAVGGSVPCSRVSPQLWYWGWRECWLFTPPTYNPCRTWDSNPQPSGYKSNSLSIKPRLPLRCANTYALWSNSLGPLRFFSSYFWKKSLSKCCIYLIIKYSKIYFIYILFFLCNLFCDGKAEFLGVITPVFIFTWSFRNHSNTLIWCSSIISSYD